MSTTAAPPIRFEPSAPRLVKHGIISWLSATDHKRIGLLYMSTSFGFFILAGVLSLAIRTQLAQPNGTFVDAHVYAQLFTLHGTAMIFLFVAPFGFGLANYLIPLQIGGPDMVFPRLNAVSYWFFLFGGITIFSGAAAQGGAASAGWYAYAPLSSIQISSGAGQDLWVIGLLMTSVSSIMTAINFVTTILLYRAPGMTMWRMPIFTWEMLATSILMLMAFPPLATCFILLLVDRRMGGHAYDPSAGGSAILYQHLFWFFGHPEVYIMILPYFGVITEVIATFSGKPVFGYFGLVLSSLAIASLSMGVWAHHMFTTGAVTNPFFAGMSFLIGVATGIKFWNWIGTMWRGAIRLTTPMLFSMGFLLNFLLGGVMGMMVASPPLDYHAKNSYFLVSHFHYVLGGGSMFAIFAAIYFWFPKIFGVKLNETLGKINFWLTFVGFNVTFFPQIFLGMWGMPRRVSTYPDLPGWGALNLISSCGAGLLAIAVIVFLIDVYTSSLLSKGKMADNPWDAFSLEWATSSPPPEHNFHSLPQIRSNRPAFDMRHPELAAQAQAAERRAIANAKKGRFW